MGFIPLVMAFTLSSLAPSRSPKSRNYTWVLVQITTNKKSNRVKHVSHSKTSILMRTDLHFSSLVSFSLSVRASSLSFSANALASHASRSLVSASALASCARRTLDSACAYALASSTRMKDYCHPGRPENMKVIHHGA